MFFAMSFSDFYYQTRYWFELLKMPAHLKDKIINKPCVIEKTI